jgi:hypothetical protein
MTGNRKRSRELTEEEKREVAYFANSLLAAALLTECTLHFLKRFARSRRTDAVHARLGSIREDLEPIRLRTDALAREVLEERYPKEANLRKKLWGRIGRLLRRM